MYQAVVTWLSGWSPADTWDVSPRHCFESQPARISETDVSLPTLALLQVVETPLKVFQTAAVLEVRKLLMGHAHKGYQVPSEVAMMHQCMGFPSMQWLSPDV